jgi:hypothetical protein
MASELQQIRNKFANSWLNGFLEKKDNDSINKLSNQTKFWSTVFDNDYYDKFIVDRASLGFLCRALSVNLMSVDLTTEFGKQWANMIRLCCPLLDLIRELHDICKPNLDYTDKANKKNIDVNIYLNIFWNPKSVNHKKSRDLQEQLTKANILTIVKEILQRIRFNNTFINNKHGDLTKIIESFTKISSWLPKQIEHTLLKDDTTKIITEEPFFHICLNYLNDAKNTNNTSNKFKKTKYTPSTVPSNKPTRYPGDKLNQDTKTKYEPTRSLDNKTKPGLSRPSDNKKTKYVPSTVPSNKPTRYPGDKLNQDTKTKYEPTRPSDNKTKPGLSRPSDNKTKPGLSRPSDNKKTKYVPSIVPSNKPTRYPGDKLDNDKEYNDNKEDNDKEDNDKEDNDNKEDNDKKKNKEVKEKPIKKGKIGKHAGNPDRDKSKYNKNKDRNMERKRIDKIQQEQKLAAPTSEAWTTRRITAHQKLLEEAQEELDKIDIVVDEDFIEYD